MASFIGSATNPSPTSFTVDLTPLAGSTYAIAAVIADSATTSLTAGAVADGWYIVPGTGATMAVFATHTPGTSVTFSSTATHVAALVLGFTGVGDDSDGASSTTNIHAPNPTVTCPDITYAAAVQHSVLGFACFTHHDYNFGGDYPPFTPTDSFGSPYTQIAALDQQWFVPSTTPPGLNLDREFHIAAAWRPNVGGAAATIAGAVDTIGGNVIDDDAESWYAATVNLAVPFSGGWGRRSFGGAGF